MEKILIFSPDTDIYHVGLVHMHKMPDKDVVVQLSRGPGKVKFLHINALLDSSCRHSLGYQQNTGFADYLCVNRM